MCAERPQEIPFPTETTHFDDLMLLYTPLTRGQLGRTTNFRSVPSINPARAGTTVNMVCAL